MRSQFRFLSTRRYNNVDLGLLIIRLITAGTIAIKHGWEKASEFQIMLNNPVLHFPDPFHIGHRTSLTIALIADFYCSILIMLGLGTRYAAGFSFLSIFTAWSMVHHFSYFGPRGAKGEMFGPQGDHGEIIVLMLGVLLGLIFSGPGRYSVDYVLADQDGE